MSFRALHVPGDPFVIPNPWDIGSACLLKSQGFPALATTSAGAAFALGQQDGTLTLDQMLHNADAIQRATGLPVNADLEGGGDNTVEAAQTAIQRASALGLAGASIEDLDADGNILPFDLTLDRVRAAIAARQDLVLTARTEIMLDPNPNFDETLRRITAFAAAGADVVFAPGLTSPDQIWAVVTAANGTPVNVLIGNNTLNLTTKDLAALGVARISTGSGMARAAYGALIKMGEDIRASGTLSYPDTTASFAKIDTLLR